MSQVTATSSKRRSKLCMVEFSQVLVMFLIVIEAQRSKCELAQLESRSPENVARALELSLCFDRLRSFLAC